MRFLLTTLLLLTIRLTAQNLVVNPGFESATYPPIETWPRENSPGTKVVEGWVTPTPATPDYYNSNRSVCDGFPLALARTGEGRCAFIAGMTIPLPNVRNYKEYLHGELKEPLTARKTYHVSFYITLDCSSPITSTGIGAYFSSGPVRNQSKEKLNLIPQVVSYNKISHADGWVQISGTFIASGGEKYLTIGSFSDTGAIRISSLGQSARTFISSPHIRNNAYFYLDDVCVSPEGSDNCFYKKTVIKAPVPERYLFLLDASNSMNEKGKLKLMKKQMKRFADSLSFKYAQIAVMTFNAGTQLPLPFTTPSEKDRIHNAIDGIKAIGTTNGDLALRRVSRLLDSMRVPGKCNVIIATDGIFFLSAKTKRLTDSSFARNSASCLILQFGENINLDLQELARTVPESSYHQVNRNNVADILDEEFAGALPPLPEPTDTVYYTSMSRIISKQFIDAVLRNYPDDEFLEIPRR